MPEPVPTKKAQSPSERLQRLHRAVLLADVLQASGVNAQMAAMATEDPEHNDWSQIAEAVRQMGEPFYNTPSEQTQRLAIALLQRRESWAEKLRSK